MAGFAPSPHTAEGEQAASSHKGNNPFPEGPVLMISSPPKAPPPNTVTLGFGETQTFHPWYTPKGEGTLQLKWPLYPLILMVWENAASGREKCLKLILKKGIFHFPNAMLLCYFMYAFNSQTLWKPPC